MPSFASSSSSSSLIAPFTPRCSFRPICSLRSSDTHYIFLVICVYAVNYLLFEFPLGPQVSTINVISYNICSARTGLSLSEDCYFTSKSPRAQQLAALGAWWERSKPLHDTSAATGVTGNDTLWVKFSALWCESALWNFGSTSQLIWVRKGCFSQK